MTPARRVVEGALVASVVVAASSCGGGTGPAEPADGTLDPAAAAALVSSDPLALGIRASGSRLRVRELATAAEGAIEAAGFHDALRKGMTAGVLLGEDVTDRLVTIPVPFAGTQRIARTVVHAWALMDRLGGGPLGAELSPVLAFDRQLGAACTFRLAADGKIRCLPAVPVLSEVEYRDSQCTMPLLELDPSCGLVSKQYVDAWATQDRCGPARAFTRVADRPTTDDTTRGWRIDPMGACVPRPVVNAGIGGRAAQRIPEADLVEAQLVTR